MKLCRYLRWKGFYGRRWRTEQELQVDLVRSDVPFSCLQTCRNWGPDDDVAAPERCQPGRSCFVLSDKQPKVAVS